MFTASILYTYHLYGVFVVQVIHFVEDLGAHVKGRSQKTLKSLLEVPYVAHLQLQVLSFNMKLILSVVLDRYLG